jgi:hypothetical protein
MPAAKLACALTRQRVREAVMASKLLFNDVVCIVCDVVLCVTPFDVSEMVFFCEECAEEVPDPVLVSVAGNG